MCSNPLLFKINYINGDRLDYTDSASAVLGRAFHAGLQAYYGGEDATKCAQEDANRVALETAMAYLEGYDEGFIKYGARLKNRQSIADALSYALNCYFKERPLNKKDDVLAVEEEMSAYVDILWKGKELSLPIRLKGFADRIVMNGGKLRIYDPKTCYSFSDPDKIDGAKMIQAVQYYLLAYAIYGIEPYSMVFEEIKYTKNRDGSAQVRDYEIVFADNELFFDFYFRLYEDVTRALMGEMVYLPNISALYETDISIISYIHRLDEEEEKAKQMKRLKVENITDVLKKRLQKASSMKKYLHAIEKDFMSAKGINYKTMKTEEKIKTKLLEHGILVDFDSVSNGPSVDLYKFTPSVGVKMKRLNEYKADIEQVLGVSGVRILAPIPNTSLVGFEVTRSERTFPDLPKNAKGFMASIGKDSSGKTYQFDLRSAPHLLVAGTTGSGKSVFISTLIEQLNRMPKKSAEICLFDPKVVELHHFSKHKNVIAYEDDILKIAEELDGLVIEMNARYRDLKKHGVRDIADVDGLPYKFVFIDEFGDLIMQNKEVTEVSYEHTGKFFASGPRKGQEKVIEHKNKRNISKEIERNILLLAQKARGAGIHLVLSTQRPSTDIITGAIKANFPTKVLFRTAKAVDSQVVIDQNGGESLLGKGDMLFSSSEGVMRLQGFNL